MQDTSLEPSRAPYDKKEQRSVDQSFAVVASDADAASYNRCLLYIFPSFVEMFKGSIFWIFELICFRQRLGIVDDVLTGPRSAKNFRSRFFDQTFAFWV